MRTEIKEQIEGYAEIVKENKVLRKYAANSSLERGDVLDTINLLHPKQLNLKVSKIIPETESTTTLRLVSESGYLPPFQAGQYLNLFVEINGIRSSRPYSISSSPNQTAYYDITIRRVNEGFVSDFLLESLKVGDKLTSTSPTGNFYYNPLTHGKDLLFIAGGSGITPFMSMIREVTDKVLDRNIHLIYGSRTEDDIVYRDELDDREKSYSNLKISHIISEPSNEYSGDTGFITGEYIQSRAGSLEDKMIYVCGPEAMYSFVLKELEKLEVPRRKLRVEVFGPPADVTKQPAWPEAIGKNTKFKITLNSGKSIEAKAGEPLMNSLERVGKELPASCRSGECSLCRTKLISGKVFHPNGVKIRKSDAKYGYIHPCMAYPLEDLNLLI